MKKYLALALSVSRGKFWIYLGGTYLVGFAAAARTVSQFLDPWFLFHLIYFLFFANIFLYGVNDFYDEETDVLNEKKGSVEHLLAAEERERLMRLLFAVFLLSILFVFYQGKIVESILFCLFLFLSYFYSAPPLRFKARPFLDFSSNVLYIIPGLLGFIHAGGILGSPWLLLGLFCWIGAMHLYSAIPDIIPDRAAGIQTTAVVLDVRKSLVLCCLLWLVFAVTIVLYAGLGVFSALGFIYVLIPFCLLFLSEKLIAKVYWYFPYLTGILGFMLFWYFVISKGL